MTDKPKRKQNRQEYAPFWMYGVFLLIMLATSIFPIFHILDAYPHVHEYQSLARITIRSFGFILALVLFIGVFIDINQRRKFAIFFATIFVSYLTLFHDGIGLMYVGFIVSPIALLSFPAYILALLIIRFRRHIHTTEILTLVGISCIVSINIITGSWYMTVPYQVVTSQNIGEESYHLILDSGFLNPTHIKLYKCNDMGILCNTIYRTGDSVDFDDEIEWQISENLNNPTITIFVNDEAIHTEQISKSPNNQ